MPAVVRAVVRAGLYATGAVLMVAGVVFGVELPEPSLVRPARAVEPDTRQAPQPEPAAPMSPTAEPSTRCVIEVVLMSEHGDGRLPTSLEPRRSILLDETLARFRGFELIETHRQPLPLDVETMTGGRVELRRDRARAEPSDGSLRLSLHVLDGERTLVQTDYRIDSGGTLAVRGPRRGDAVEIMLVTCDG